MKNIEQFCKETGFTFVKDGEVGFGRKCVGILDDRESFLEYQPIDSKTYETIGQHTVAVEKAPPNAYHKSTCLAVLMDNIDEIEATEQLERWIEAILKAGYVLKNYVEANSVNALLGRAHGKYLADKE
jgi:hypothetical protein